MSPGGSLDLIKDWGRKLPGEVARIAGQLHMAEFGKAGIEKPISVTFVTASCVLGGYFREHAIAAFNQMKEDPRINTAKKILSYLKRNELPRSKLRGIKTRIARVVDYVIFYTLFPVPASSVSYTHLRAHETRHDLVC